MVKLLMEFVGTLDASLKHIQKQADRDSGFQRLTISQLQYIDAIVSLGTAALSAVAKQVGVSKASATTAINKLQSLGYAEKNPSCNDSRVIQVSLSQAGQHLFEAKLQALEAYGGFVSSALSPDEIDQFTRIITKLVNHFQQGSPS